MATRTCPTCGAQYVATVRRCIDCDVPLVDETRPTGPEDEVEPVSSTAAPLGDGDQVGYELEGWGNQLKVTLEGMLDRAGIARAWEAGALVVAAQDEEAVDDLIATLEGGEVDDLGDDEPQVALEIDGLDADAADELDARLLAEAVPHAWDDEGALLVREADEERVLAIIDEVFEAEDDDDGLAASRALSAAYVAVDRLVKDPHDPKLATAYRAAAADVAGLAVPYGFEGPAWRALVDQTEALAAAVAPFADDEADEPAAVEDPAGDGERADAEGAEAEPSDDAADGVADDEVDAEDADADAADDDDAGADAAGGSEADDEVDPVERDRAAAIELRTALLDLV